MFLYTRLGVCSVLDAFYERQGCNRESSERSQRVGDTEILTSDLKDVAECIPELRSALRSLPVDRTVSTEKAQKAADKIAVIPIPNFKTGNSESAASH